MERPVNKFTETVKHNLFVSALEPDQSSYVLVRTLFKRKNPRSVRFRAGIQLASKPFALGGIDAKAALYNRYYNSEGVPFKNSPTLIGYGWENLVFLVEGDKPFVVKLDKKSLGMSLQQQQIRAKDLQSQHEQIAKWFGGVEGFVTSTQPIIAHLPFMNKKAVGLMQPYIPEFKGVFEDYTDEQLATLLAQDAPFRRSFIRVADTFFTNLADEGKSIDIIGDRNLNIKNTNGTHQLFLLDSCSIHTLAQMQNFASEFDTRIQRLHELRAKALH